MIKSNIKTVTILGATGSVGSATIDIVRQQQRALGKQAIQIKALTARSNWQKLAQLALEFQPEFVGLLEEDNQDQFREALAGLNIEIVIGSQSAEEAAAKDADWVMAAITGAAGLRSVLIAAKRGCSLALANKESLVCAGSLLINVCSQYGTILLPVDSEHNAIFQVFDPAKKHLVEKIILTASGGPFRNWAAEDIANATPEQAIAHPIWSMGAKISVDSANLMNKGLELIEARHLFDVSPNQLEVLVHPQSVVHGLVQYKDGSMLAQLGPPDMRVPIASAWAWPERIALEGAHLSLAEVGRLDFEHPNLQLFPALSMAICAMQTGANACNALNAANEVAVASFLQGNIKFSEITEVIDAVLNHGGGEIYQWSGEPTNIDEVFEIDKQARIAAKKRIQTQYCR